LRSCRKYIGGASSGWMGGFDLTSYQLNA
jgi:hypothetical protein